MAAAEQAGPQKKLSDLPLRMPTAIEAEAPYFEILELAAARPDALASDPIMLTGDEGCDAVLYASDLFRLAARVCESLEHRVNPLTGLPGRVQCEQRVIDIMHERANPAVRTAIDPLRVAFIDIRGFNICNTVLGFQIGDQLIRTLAGIILGVIEEHNDPGAYLGHLTEDRFIMIASDEMLRRIASEVPARFNREAGHWTAGAAAAFVTSEAYKPLQIHKDDIHQNHRPTHPCGEPRALGREQRTGRVRPRPGAQGPGQSRWPAARPASARSSFGKKTLANRPTRPRRNCRRLIRASMPGACPPNPSNLRSRPPAGSFRCLSRPARSACSPWPRRSRPMAAGTAPTSSSACPPAAGSWLFDMPCPTCGMTTSFTHAANGDPIAAFAAQPAGTLLAITTAAVFFGSIHTALFGVRVGRLFRPLGGAKSIWIMIASLLLAWIYKNPYVVTTTAPPPPVPTTPRPDHAPFLCLHTIFRRLFAPHRTAHAGRCQLPENTPMPPHTPFPPTRTRTPPASHESS